MTRNQRASVSIERMISLTIFCLIFGLPAEAAIKNVDQCREAVDAFASTLSDQARIEEAKTEIFDAWNSCKVDDFEAADAKLKAAKALILEGM
ncbi:MAG: hypothetical protein ACSHXI_20470 [Hoeflea sp.]|uniref:hypothetical protein n=1 Tax=Hoeflea sp. TaxID=1940281 RepID=UPI003EF39000